MLDVLILDGVDRMLSDGFADELKEIISACPTARRMMLFFASMTKDADAPVRMPLHHPLRFSADPKRPTARGLLQEFVRVRAEREKDRSALLAALCKRTCKPGVMIFFRSENSRLKAEQLHRDLMQEHVRKILPLDLEFVS